MWWGKLRPLDQARYGGGIVAARTPADRKLEAIEDAPGSYVAVRAQD